MNEADLLAMALLQAKAEANSTEPNATDQRTCKVCGSPESAWRTAPENSETGIDDDEMSDPKVDALARNLLPAAQQSVIAQAANYATLDERHRLLTKDSANPLDAAMKSMRKR